MIPDLPNLREVLKSLSGESNLFAPHNKVAIGFQWLGLRQVDYNKKCSCWFNTTGGSRDVPGCSRCMLTGYLYTDYLVKGYLWMGILGSEFGTPPGIISTQQKNIVVKHNRVINKFDFILELNQDIDSGQIKQPFKITKYNRIQDVVPVKGDSGRIEFWKGMVEERNIEDGTASNTGTGFKYKGNRSINEPK
jgi:hypothetical protein